MTSGADGKPRCSGFVVFMPSMFNSRKRARRRDSASLAIFVPDDQFAKQRIVERRDLVAGVEHRVEADSQAAGNPSAVTAPGDGRKFRAGPPR